MHIALVGTGAVATALGTRLAALRHRVVYGSRDPSAEAVQALVEATGHGARAASQAEAVARAEVVMLAVPWAAALATVRSLDLAGRVLVDVTNDVDSDFRPDDPSPRSCAERISAAAPGALVVKAFNAVAAGVVQDPAFGAVRPMLPVCGDDPAAKATVLGLAGALGFEAVDAGPLAAAADLEALARLWMRLAYAQGRGPNLAFALLTR